MNVKEILHRPPPPVLYHYTTQQGLLGIINNKEIWATHTQYLNDVREFRHATDLVKQELAAMVEQPRKKSFQEFLRRMQQLAAGQPESVNVCVCSFSEQGDSLPQWRAYGGAASGFAVGFSGHQLRRICSQLGWLVPVVYDEDEQRALVRQLLEDVLEEHQKRPSDPAVSFGFLTYLHRYAPLLKHKSFREEREWRIVTQTLNCRVERFGYRTGPSTLIPYFRLSLEQIESLGIEEVVIGPTPHPEQSSHSINGLLIKHKIETAGAVSEKGVRIRCSEVPYRNW